MRRPYDRVEMNFPFPPIAATRRIECRRRAIVAIPAKDEAERLPACLRALAKQTDELGHPLARGAFGVVVFANNCSDDSAQAARRAGEGAPFALRVVEGRLPRAQAHAGGARRKAMDLAEAWLRELRAFDGVILTTDADSQVAPNWICANLSGFAEGVDAVLGQISLDEDGDRLPPALHARGKLESVYGELLTEIFARLDPQRCNPWPHHSTISGATLAVTREAYLRVGRLPRVPLGEDKALVAALQRNDAAIRFAPEVSVVTSARIAGRAAGGVADTLRLRSNDPAALCDEALEPCATAFKRALWRGRLRRGGLATGGWREPLHIPADVAREVQASSTFGEAWRQIEQSSPQLAKRRMTPAELPLEIERATRLLRRLQEWLSAREDVEPVFGAALAPDNFDQALETSDEEFGGLVSG
jgi:hypothetical protein